MKINTWDVLYQTKKPNKKAKNQRVYEVRVLTLTRPPRTRIFKVPGGRKKFHAVRVRRVVKELIVYAPASAKISHQTHHITSRGVIPRMGKKDKNTEVTDDELKELEALEDVEPEADEPDAVEEETPKKGKKGKKGKKNKSSDEGETPTKRRGGAAPGKSRAAANGKVGSAEIAAAGNTDARTLRMVLRKHEIPKDSETGRYEWDSMKDPTVKKILKLLKDGEAEKVKQEGLQRLKDSKAEKDAAAKTQDAGEGKKKKGKKAKNK